MHPVLDTHLSYLVHVSRTVSTVLDVSEEKRRCSGVIPSPWVVAGTEGGRRKFTVIWRRTYGKGPFR